MSESPLRGQIWVLCWRYPFFLETIVAEEFEEMVRTGMDGILVPLGSAKQPATELDIAPERILRPVAWPERRVAKAGILVAALWRRPLGAARLLARVLRLRGDDARGALVTAVRIIEASGERRPAHVHAHFAGHLAHVASLLAAFWSCPWSASAHARDIYTKPQRLAIDFETASFVRAISTHGKEWILKFAPTLTPATVPLIHCGVHLGKFRRPNEVSAISGSRLKIVSVGRLVRKKGHDVLIEATADLIDEGFDLTCTIIGEGPESGPLRDLATRRGVGERVCFKEALSREELLDVLQSADLFVMPCRVDAEGDQDGIPLAMMEAMALGKPVIAGQAGGTLELVTKGGFTVSADEVGETRDALRRLASIQTEGRHAIGREARQRIEEAFSLETNAFSLRALLEEAAI